jgi:hypothetical protein
MRDKNPSDPRGGHLRLYWEVIDSHAWRSLTPGEQRCYVALLRGKRSTNNGDLSLPLSVARHQGIKSHTTLAAGLRALQAVGFIAITRRGGCSRGGQRLPTLYRLTDYECYEVKSKHVDACKATNDWKRIASVAQGKAFIREAHTRAKAEAKNREAAPDSTKLTDGVPSVALRAVA